ELQAGASFFIFPGELSSYTADQHRPWHYRWIGFRGTDVDQWLSRINISMHNPVTTSFMNRRVPVLFRRIERTLREGGPGCDLRAGGWMRLLLAEYASLSSAPSQNLPASDMQQQVEQAIRWIT